jgi:DUF1009 family protein
MAKRRDRNRPRGRRDAAADAPPALPPVVILAGGGDFPLLAAEQAIAGGREVLIAGIEGEASPGIEDFPHCWVKRGQLGALFSLSRRFGARDMLLLGHVLDRRMPTWREVDWRGLYEVIRHRDLLANGDDSVLRRVARIIERNGFRVVGPGDVAPGLVAGTGLYGSVRPNEADLRDVLAAFQAAKALGRRDVGQAAVADGGVAIKLEDGRGTDAMLADVAKLRRSGGAAERSGVLVKCQKPGQDPRLDLPAVGPATIANAAAAGLAGVGIEAGRTLLIDPDIATEVADRLGLFLLGFNLPDNVAAAEQGAGRGR